jgi:hypothetical protein
MRWKKSRSFFEGLSFFQLAGFEQLKTLLYGESKRPLSMQSPNDHYQDKPKSITVNAEHKRLLSTQSTNDRYKCRAQTITINAQH